MTERPSDGSPALSTEEFHVDVRGRRVVLRDQRGYGAGFSARSLEAVARRLRPGHVVDLVGAGAGVSALLLAAHGGCAVRAFEGSEAHAELLDENLAANPALDVVRGHIRYENPCCPALGARDGLPTIEFATDPSRVSYPSYGREVPPALIWLHASATGEQLLASPEWAENHRRTDYVLSGGARRSCAPLLRALGLREVWRSAELSIHSPEPSPRPVRAMARERLPTTVRAAARRLRDVRHGGGQLAHEGLSLGVGSYVNGEAPRLQVVGERSPKPVVGRFSSIASGVTFVVGGGHRSDYVTTSPVVALLAGEGERSGHGTSRGPIVVGNDVWIGFGATIMSGVTIGDGAIVGARSVVTRSVPKFSVVAGAPAVVTSERFPAPIARSLERIRWWDWDETLVASHRYVLESRQVEAFCAAHDPAWGRESARDAERR